MDAFLLSNFPSTLTLETAQVEPYISSGDTVQCKVCHQLH